MKYWPRPHDASFSWWISVRKWWLKIKKFGLNTGEYNSTKNTLIRIQLSSPNGPKHILKTLKKPAVQDLPDKSIVIMRSLHGAQEENAYRDDHLSDCPSCLSPDVRWTDFDELLYEHYAAGSHIKRVIFNFLKTVRVTWQTQELMSWKQH